MLVNVTICVKCSVPTNLGRLKNLNTYVYPRGKAGDYDLLLDIWNFFGFKVMTKNEATPPVAARRGGAPLPIAP
jgi:hypothetical protein